MSTEHVLERRASLLAVRLREQKDNLVQALAPKGTRPPFHTQLSNAEALSFWQEHRYDAVGAKLLAAMDATSILELDNALAKANEAAMFGGEGNGLY